MIEPRFTVRVARNDATSLIGMSIKEEDVVGEADARSFIAEKLCWESTLWVECEALGVRQLGSFNPFARDGSDARGVLPGEEFAPAPNPALSSGHDGGVLS